MEVEEIEEILIKIGFIKKEHYYDFYQKYPNYDGSNLKVSFEQDDFLMVHCNCLNYASSNKVSSYKTIEDFLYHLDVTVLNGRGGFIYSSRTYYNWSDAADNQRKKYFHNRMKMEIKPDPKIIEAIESEGLDHFETALDVRYRGKKIGEMNWEELANALKNELKKESDKTVY